MGLPRIIRATARNGLRLSPDLLYTYRHYRPILLRETRRFPAVADRNCHAADRCPQRRPGRGKRWQTGHVRPTSRVEERPGLSCRPATSPHRRTDRRRPRDPRSGVHDVVLPEPRPGVRGLRRHGRRGARGGRGHRQADRRGGSNDDERRRRAPARGRQGTTAGLHATLRAVTKEQDDADLLAYCGDATPESVLRANESGYDGAPPLSWVTSPPKLVGYDLGAGWTVSGLDLRRTQLGALVHRTRHAVTRPPGMDRLLAFATHNQGFVGRSFTRMHSRRRHA